MKLRERNIISLLLSGSHFTLSVATLILNSSRGAPVIVQLSHYSCHTLSSHRLMLRTLHLSMYFCLVELAPQVALNFRLFCSLNRCVQPVAPLRQMRWWCTCRASAEAGEKVVLCSARSLTQYTRLPPTVAEAYGVAREVKGLAKKELFLPLRRDT